MITEKDLLLNNKSYINKDFASIYPEEVDLFKKMTNRYDPETSNESDPFIVNLKTNAFVADKLCYNIDKNVLENYMPSATQESSMRDLCGRLGYEMKYYNASATEIYFKYTGTVFNDYEEAWCFEVPRFTTVTSQDGAVVFTTIKSAQYSRNDEFITIEALQGTLESLTVADSDVIQLENLNSQNRVYFNESIVAENGVFITSVDDEEEWVKTDNLNLELPNTRCYKFGYDSTLRWPYIEFPSDVASLIGSGLHISYLVTQGENGNVNANYLTEVSNNENFKFYTQVGDLVVNRDGSGDIVVVNLTDEDASELIIKNISASIGGCDPETINSAYNNFKKTIGTFDTLVTCRDYANAIYNLYDRDDVYHVVSNIQVADRRDDINYSNKILSLDKYGTCYTYGNSTISAFDLCLYPLKPITSYTAENYTESFRPKLETSYIKSSIEDAKTISHDYKQLNADDIYAIINKYKLNVKLTTTYKVNQYERVSIIANVLDAIIKNFNAREVDYGEEIPYDTILDVIKNADERINYVGMAEPVPTTCFLKSGGTEVSIDTTEGRGYYLSILARNILAGKISLFDFYNMFSFEFNQTDGNIHSELESIESHAKITLTPSDDVAEYTLSENEAIQVVGPSFVTTASYSYGIRYHYGGLTVARDTEYELKQNEQLIISYKPSGSDDRVTKTYTEGTIIKPNFELADTDTVSGTVDGYAMIQSDEQIDIRELNQSNLNSYTYCYWLRNTHEDEKSNVLFTANDVISVTEGGQTKTYYRVMLQDGEYFFYKRSLKEDFISVGSGTILTIPELLYNSNSWYAEVVSMDDILNEGSNAIKWISRTFSDTQNLNIQETTILTLTAGDSIKLDGLTSAIVLDNDLQALSDSVNVKYTIANGTEESLGEINYNSSDEVYKWRIKSRLDIDAGPYLAQIVDSGKANSEHNIKFTFKDDTSLPASGFYGDSSHKNFSFKLNEKQQFVGSSNIDATSYDVTETSESNRIKYSLEVYVFKKPAEIDNVEYHRNDLGFINVIVNNDTFTYATDDYSTESSSVEFNTTLKLPLNKKSILTIYYQKNDNTANSPVISSYSDYNATTEVNGLSFFNYSNSEVVSSSKLLKSGINVFEISSSVKAIKFSVALEGGVVGVMSISKLTYLNTTTNNPNAYNLVLKLKENEDSSLLTKIRSIDTNHEFYYNSEITSDNLIDTDDMSSPYAFYDYNNIANKFVLSKIDISSDGGTIIDVVRTSMK